MARVLFVAGAAIFALLGVAHGVLTLRDLGTPRSFVPTDEQAHEVMARARLRLAPRTSIWNAWLGFNLSHSLGLLVFGTLLGGLALGDFPLVARSSVLRGAAIVVSTTYVLLAIRFWFWVPVAASALGTLCFIGAAFAV